MMELDRIARAFSKNPKDGGCEISVAVTGSSIEDIETHPCRWIEVPRLHTRMEGKTCGSVMQRTGGRVKEVIPDVPRNVGLSIRETALHEIESRVKLLSRAKSIHHGIV